MTVAVPVLEVRVTVPMESEVEVNLFDSTEVEVEKRVVRVV